jgi:hypothetical protein
MKCKFYQKRQNFKPKPWIFFIFNFVLQFGIAYHINIYSFTTVLDISSGKNLLHHALKFLTFGGRFCQILVGCVEEFLTRALVAKMRNDSQKIEQILGEISCKKLNKINRRRKFLAIAQTIFHESIYLVRSGQKFSHFLTFGSRFGRTLLSFLIIIRFCFFVDFVNLHLLAILKAINCGFVECSKGEKMAVWRMLKLRKCYYHVMIMQRRFEGLFWWTMRIYFPVLLLSIVRRSYKVYNVLMGNLPMKELPCE